MGSSKQLMAAQKSMRESPPGVLGIFLKNTSDGGPSGRILSDGKSDWSSGVQMDSSVMTINRMIASIWGAIEKAVPCSGMQTAAVEWVSCNSA